MALGADWPGRRFLLSWPFSRRLERSSDLLGHRLCRAERGRQRGLLGQVGHSSKVSLVLLRHEPEMEVRCSLHQGQEVGALDSGGRLDRRNEPMEDGAELGALGWRISPKSNRWRLASTMTVPALDDFSGACSTRKYSPSTIEPAGRGPSRSADPVFRPSCCRQMFDSVGQLPRNGRKAAKNCSGTSRWGMCPHSGTTTREARGMSCAAAAESPTKSPSRAASSGLAYWPSGTT